MSTLGIGFILLLTIVAALGTGIIIGYYLLGAILHFMGHRPHPQAPALVTSEAHSGD